MIFKFFADRNMTEMQDICRCLTNLLNIPSGSIPLSRGMGVDWSVLSKIPPELENDLATEIVEKIETYEPRVSVEKVEFTYDSSGTVTANIALEEGEGNGW